MNNILATSKVYGNFQTSIPKEIRKNFNVDKNTILEWGLNDEGKTTNWCKRQRKSLPLVNFYNSVYNILVCVSPRVWADAFIVCVLSIIAAPFHDCFV